MLRQLRRPYQQAFQLSPAVLASWQAAWAAPEATNSSCHGSTAAAGPQWPPLRSFAVCPVALPYCLRCTRPVDVNRRWPSLGWLRQRTAHSIWQRARHTDQCQLAACRIGIAPAASLCPAQVTPGCMPSMTPATQLATLLTMAVCVYVQGAAGGSESEDDQPPQRASSAGRRKRSLRSAAEELLARPRGGEAGT